ncbi:response regulator [Paenibacillus glacialis]|uniref:DNA-binding response regulator n=1 Tax=Paenibacillus glacialis TaxID=494026 RepID=A0A168C1C0_9BACL|nr:response regulator [Paenibacillus glacialis]OAB32958.1 hypothetical protein PGLA_26115 [Paenibacillus glacialis]
MFTILVVDDHAEEREGISFLIQELSFPLQLETAENGQKALNYLEQHSVDILFTDVRMPLMDGLQLTEHVLRLHPKTKVILFSGFAEFEYAKTAMRLGVSDYLLKPVNVEAFKETMERVIVELTDQQHKDEASQMKLAYVKKHILFTLVNGIGEEPSMKGLSLGLPTHYHNAMLLEFEKDFFENVGPEFEEFLLSLLEIPVDYLNLNGCQSLLLFPEPNKLSRVSYHELALRINNSILIKYKVHCYLAINEELSAIQDIAGVLPQLEKLMEYRFFLSDTYVFDARNELIFSDQVFPNLADNHILDQIRNSLNERNSVSLRANIELLYQKYVRQVQFSHLYVKHTFSTLYQDVMKYTTTTSEMDLNIGIEKIYKSEDLRDIKDIIMEGITRLEQDSNHLEPTQNRDISVTKQYIEEYYAEDLSLEILAAKVYLSPHYLSSIFKKHTGCGLNKYIKNVRMQKAKDMLTNTHLKISDICIAVGYRNISYFCQNFRDFYGHTPEKFRQYNQRSLENLEDYHANLADS